MAFFSKNKRTPLSSGAPAGAGNESAFFGTNLRVKGKVSGNGNLIVMGRVEGEFDLNGELVLAGSASVSGEIKAVSISVSGNFTGNLVAQEKMHLEKSALVNGRLTTPRLSVADGACFNGELEMKKTTAVAAAPKSAEKH
jgi:cytoskeletal protein CcmA (bactofilin family)